MTLETPIQTLASCLSSAQYVDMPEIIDKRRRPNTKPFTGNRSDREEYEAWSNYAYEEYSRKHYAHELHVEAMFPQTWGSTALGFGGMGGQAITSAYTTIIGSYYDNCFCVYFGGRFAYRLDLSKCDMEKIQKDICRQSMADVRSCGVYLKDKS